MIATINVVNTGGSLVVSFLVESHHFASKAKVNKPRKAKVETSA